MKHLLIKIKGDSMIMKILEHLAEELMVLIKIHLISSNKMFIETKVECTNKLIQRLEFVVVKVKTLQNN